HLVAQVRGETGRGGVVEHGRGRQADPGGGGQPVAEPHAQQRVEPEVLERAVDRHGVGGLVVQHGGDVPADEVGDDAFLLVGGQPGQAGRQFGGAGTRLGELGFRGLQRPPYLGQGGDQRTGTRGGEGDDESVPVDVRDDDGGLVMVERL